MNNTIRLEIDLGYHENRYKNITDKEEFYSSPDYHKAYNSWRKSRGGSPDNDLLKDLATSPFRGDLRALDIALRENINKNVIDVLDDIIRGYTR